MVHRRLVYIYLNVPSFSSRYFNKIKRTSRLGRLLALSLEILTQAHGQVYQVSCSYLHVPSFCHILLCLTYEFGNHLEFPLAILKMEKFAMAT